MNKKVYLLMLCLCAAMPLMAQRDTISLNDGWQFLADRDGKADYSQGTPLTGAVVVDVPHDFQIEQPWVAPDEQEKGNRKDAANNTASRLSARGFKEMGYGWYRKVVVADSNWRDRRVVLDFEGIMLVGDVWLNGEHVGGTDYGYVGFEIDITKNLKYGQENVLVVRADTRSVENSRWYTGGGLFRNVSLVVMPKDKYFTRHPLYITTKDNRQVCIKAGIYYADRHAKNLHVVTRIRDAEGRVVAESTSTPRYYRSQKRWEYPLEPVTLPSPRLWSPDTPYLYTAEVTLTDAEGNVQDRAVDRFGVRAVVFTPQQGMLLNGQKVLLKGWANHHTLGVLGAAAYPRAIEKRLRLMKQFGFNHIRTSHNPYSNDLYRLCDELGILVVDELYDKWTKQFAGGRTDWMNLWTRDIPEWVQRDRNHPCVVLWSLGNELQQMSNLPFNDWGVTAYRLQRELLQRYDSTRLTTVAMHPRYRDLSTDSLPAPLARVTDIQSYNYRYMYFPGDSRRFPHMIFYQSEANMTGLPGNFFEMDLDRVVGLAYWGAIDYLGESRGWPLKGWADGFFDISLQPKPVAWLVRSMFLPDEPLVRLAIIDHVASETEWNGIKFNNDQTSEHWNRQPGERLTLHTYTNADEVELIVNGKSLGRQHNPKDNPKHRNIITWQDVEYQPGYIEAVARTDGRVVARYRSETTGPAVALRIEPDLSAVRSPDTGSAYWHADGQDLQHVRITAVDKKGRRVPTASDDVVLSVSGPARLVAVGNGNMAGNDVASQQHIHLYQGSALAILRSTSEAGTVVLTAAAPSYRKQELKMKTYSKE